MKLLLTAAAGLLLSHAALAQDHRAKPHLVMHRSVEGMPRGSTQEVSVLTADNDFRKSLKLECRGAPPRR